MKIIIQIFILVFAVQSLSAKRFIPSVLVGAEQPNEYMSFLKKNNGDMKRVALLVNQTSKVGDEHLVDNFIANGVDVKKIFAPEHGFRGKADAGAHVKSGVDSKTGLPIISLYGKNKKPTAAQLQDIDVVVFDIQDVGVRFYTYISTLQYMMEACSENQKELLILDRPNPNGFYVDGPVLNKKYKSFVGMQSIPIVHGMTVGEYANMINAEGWLRNGVACIVNVVPCKNYDHSMLYDLPVPPSPNLRSPQAILLYPTLCLFEGTEVSVGRGTETPFEIWGNPDYRKLDYVFTPKPSAGASNPKYKNQACRGQDMHASTYEIMKMFNGKIDINLLKFAYSNSPRTDKFFNPFFEKLAGTNELRKQILAKKSVEEIRKSWEPELSKFKETRKKYLLYPDFE